jgi:hypothetical protein
MSSLLVLIAPSAASGGRPAFFRLAPLPGEDGPAPLPPVLGWSGGAECPLADPAVTSRPSSERVLAAAASASPSRAQINTRSAIVTGASRGLGLEIARARGVGARETRASMAVDRRRSRTSVGVPPHDSNRSLPRLSRLIAGRPRGSSAEERRASPTAVGRCAVIRASPEAPSPTVGGQSDHSLLLSGLPAASRPTSSASGLP